MKPTKKETRVQRFDRGVAELTEVLTIFVILLVGFILFVCLIVGVSSL